MSVCSLFIVVSFLLIKCSLHEFGTAEVILDGFSIICMVSLEHKLTLSFCMPSLISGMLQFPPVFHMNLN